MIDRCYKPANDNYRWYGATGTYVCKRWRESVQAFIEDMGLAPSSKHSIDRIKSDGGSYTCGHCEDCRERNQPANCRWATKAEQVRNCKNNLWFTHDGETLILKDWARKLGIPYTRLWQRIYAYGVPFETAIAEQSGMNRKRHLVNGQSLTIAEMSRMSNVPYGTLHARLSSGWDAIKAMSVPVDHR